MNGTDVLNEDFDSLSNYDDPLTLRYDLNFKDFSKSDMVYFDPVLTPSLKAISLSQQTGTIRLNFLIKWTMCICCLWIFPRDLK